MTLLGRLVQLERAAEVADPAEVSWAEYHAAAGRCASRALLKFFAYAGREPDRQTLAALAGDTPEQEAADHLTLARWAKQRDSPPDPDALERILSRLDQLARTGRLNGA